RCAVAQEMCGLPAWTKLSNVRMCLSRLEKPVGLPFGINFAGIHMPMSSRPAILITGAAAGIGRAAAERFARAGWFVGLYDLDEAGTQELQQQLRSDQGIAGRLDMAQADDWQAALDVFFQA